MIESKDKAGEEYWSNVWKNSSLPEPLTTNSLNPNNYLERKLHGYFSNLFEGRDVKGKSILEIGCGNSVWLPYFANEFGMNVFGLDYSEIGCEQSRKILAREKINGEIICADFYNAPDSLKNRFDFVISMGVAEHFTDTSEVLKIFSSFLKKDGILITEIPNMTGVLGYLHKKLNKPVYDIHKLIDKKQLSEAHTRAGLSVIKAQYLISMSFHVNVEGKDGQISFYNIKKWFVYSLSSFAKIIWLFEILIASFPEGKLLSPVILVAARK